MKNKIKISIAVVAIICIIVFSVIIIKVQSDRDSQDVDVQQNTVSENSENTREESNAADGTAQDFNVQNEEQLVEDETKEANLSPEDETQEGLTGNDPSTDGPEDSGSPSSGQAQDPYPTLPEPEEPAGELEENRQISFPYTIPNTSLVIESIASYDGIFLEDGSDTSVTGIYSMMLKNNGDKDVEYARIALSCNGTPITFEVSDIPSGATVVAQEINKTAYQNGTYSNCSADLAESDGLEQSEDIVSVKEDPDGALTVTNLTDSQIPCVRIFYKFYMNDENAYVGGITYTAKLVNLEAGAEQTIVPSHYSQGYSKVVMVRTYDTSD